MTVPLDILHQPVLVALLIGWITLVATLEQAMASVRRMRVAWLLTWSRLAALGVGLLQLLPQPLARQRSVLAFGVTLLSLHLSAFGFPRHGSSV